jgi:formylglycine-generating enzyme required for sulfatase activity/uncharacterized caspase-like protein
MKQKLSLCMLMWAVFTSGFVFPINAQDAPKPAESSKMVDSRPATYTRGMTPGLVRHVDETGKVKEIPRLYDSSHALVIGMTDYVHWKPLKGPQQDVDEVKAVLTEHGFDVTVNMNLKSEQLEKTIGDYLKVFGRDGNKRIIVYFAGHGHTMRSADGRDFGYIVPVDAPDPRLDENKFKDMALDFKTITSMADRMGTKHSLFIFDSCFSGHLTTRSDSEMIPPAISLVAEKPARQFITSGSSDQTVNDESLFRRLFVEGLRGRADTDKDSYITASELFTFLSRGVVNASARKQTPTSGRIDDANLRHGDMVFALRRDVPPDYSEDKMFEDARAEDTVAGYLLFLSTQKSNKYTQPVSVLLKDVITREMRSSPAAVSPGASVNIPRLESSAVRSASLVRKPFEFNTVTLDGAGAEVTKKRPSVDSVELDLGSGTMMRLVNIPHGKFKMGGSQAEEKPVHDVEIQSFFMGINEVTKKQWAAVSRLPRERIGLQADPAPAVLGDDRPIVNVTWEQAVEFCERLSKHTGYRFTLPSESQWEYAARAGSTTTFAFGPKLKDDVANFKANITSGVSVTGQFRNQLTPVGSFPANEFGLFDMHGNAAEWMHDSWATDYTGAPSDGFPRVTASDQKVVRGGNYASPALRVCSACRANSDVASLFIGFRVVLQSGLTQP